MLYLDNNATTIMSDDTRKAYMAWCNRGNPSADYAWAKRIRAMQDEFRGALAGVCGIKATTNTSEQPDEYRIIFTSGASESNATIISSVADAYYAARKVTPHIIMSSIEHKSLLAHAEYLADIDRIKLTLVAPKSSGHILAEDVRKEIKPTTALICIMHANNETGAINNIAEIGLVAHTANVPFHTDTVQMFGKFPLRPVLAHVDSFSISFHKFGGPPGIGALIVKRQLWTGYKLHPLVFGTQNDGCRGGTENVPGIAAAYAATLHTMHNRTDKNATMLTNKRFLMEEIGRKIPTRQYTAYEGHGPQLEIIFLSGGGTDYLPNTLLLAVVWRGSKLICNVELKKALEERGIIVSVGSACNTSSDRASHVLDAMSADTFIRKGALRISMCDETTRDELRKFVDVFVDTIVMSIRAMNT